jgi:hypothetical protein
MRGKKVSSLFEGNSGAFNGESKKSYEIREGKTTMRKKLQLKNKPKGFPLSKPAR